MEKKKSVWRNVNLSTIILISFSVLAATSVMLLAVFPFYAAELAEFKGKADGTASVTIKYVIISCVLLTGLLAILSNALFRIFIQPLYRKLAYNDYLTVAKNRNAFELDLEALEFEKDTIDTASVIVFLIHNIKEINVTLGNNAGDQIISDIANIFMSVFDHMGSTYRIGGYEFSCIALGYSSEAVDKALDEFNGKFKSYRANKMEMLSVSWGHAQLTPDEGQSFRETYNLANSKMHASAHIRNKK